MFFLYSTLDTPIDYQNLCRARILPDGRLDENQIEWLVDGDFQKKVKPSFAQFLIYDGWLYYSGLDAKRHFVIVRQSDSENLTTLARVLRDAHICGISSFTVDKDALYYVVQGNEIGSLFSTGKNGKRQTLTSLHRINKAIATGGRVYFCGILNETSGLDLFSILADGTDLRRLSRDCKDFFFADGRLYAWRSVLNEIELSRWDEKNWVTVSKSIRSGAYVSEDMRFFWVTIDRSNSEIKKGRLYTSGLQGSCNLVYERELIEQETYRIVAVIEKWVYCIFSNLTGRRVYFRVNIDNSEFEWLKFPSC